LGVTVHAKPDPVVIISREVPTEGTVCEVTDPVYVTPIDAMFAVVIVSPFSKAVGPVPVLFRKTIMEDGPPAP
jgi:hypothetical protein